MYFKAYMHGFSLIENAVIDKATIDICPFPFLGSKLPCLIRMRAGCLQEALQMLIYSFMNVENVILLYLMSPVYIFEAYELS